MPDRSREEVLASFGMAVRKLRSERGWSQEELADLTGVHRTYIGDIERGRRNVGLVNVERIAAALRITMAALMAEVERGG